MERQEKKVLIREFDAGELEGPLETVHELFGMDDNEHEQYSKATVVVETYGDEDSANSTILIYGWRLETDAEMKVREERLVKQELDKYMKEQEKIFKEKVLLQELKQKYKDL